MRTAGRKGCCGGRAQVAGLSGVRSWNGSGGQVAVPRCCTYFFLSAVYRQHGLDGN
jgi:hypothetical protein